MSFSESSKSGKLYLRYKESVPGTESSLDFFETNSCIMDMPKTVWLQESNVGKLGKGEYGKAAELQACYSTFSVKCTRLSEVIYFLSFFLGNEEPLVVIDAGDSVYSHRINALSVNERSLPTFTAIYCDGYSNHLMTHCIINNFTLTFSHGGNGRISATFTGVCNLYNNTLGGISKNIVSTPWSLGAHTLAVAAEPLINFTGCRFYIGSAVGSITHGTLDYTTSSLLDASDVSKYVDSITITGNNGVDGEEAMRAGGGIVINSQERKDFAFTCSVKVRKHRAGGNLAFYEWVTSNTQKAIEINWQGKAIVTTDRYSAKFLLPVVQIQDITESKEVCLMQVAPFYVFSDDNETAFEVFAQNQISTRYNTLDNEVEKSFTVTGTVAGGQTDYRVKILVYRGAGTDSGNVCFLNNASANWPGDLRFYQFDNTTPLKYWIEAYSGDLAEVWVELNTVPAFPGTQTFFVRYGNAADESLSSADDTFIIGDDFEDEAVDSLPSDWNIVPGTSATIKVSDDEQIHRIDISTGVSFAASAVAPDGKIWAGHQTDGTVQVSEDSGATWATKYTFTAGSSSIMCIFIASNGYIYASRLFSNILVRSTDGGETWGTCLTMSDPLRSVVWYMDEDSAGNLYAGEYSGAYAPITEENAYIYKSTDNADSWSVIYNNPDGARNIRFVRVDPYTDYIYASQNGHIFGDNKLIRSVDGGSNWTTLGSGGMEWAPTSIYFGNGYRLIGLDAIGGGVAIRKTTNDSVFTDAYTPPSTEDTGFWNGGYKRESDGLIIFGMYTQAANETATVVGSRDDGVTWIVLERYATAATNRGYHYFSNFDAYGNILSSVSVSGGGALTRKINYFFTSNTLKAISLGGDTATSYVTGLFSSVFALEYKMSAAQNDASIAVFNIRQGTTVKVSVCFNNLGDITYHNGTTFISTGIYYVVNRTYNVKCIGRLVAQTWDLYIDEVLIASDIPMRNPGTSTADRITFTTTATYQGTVYVDNVTLRQYAEPEPVISSWS